MAEVVRQERPDALVGTTINGFKIQERIGSGGFGVVYRAFDTNLERSVAIKMLPPKLAKAGQGLMDRFLREARSAAKLAHANIVTIHQICAYKETFYIVMELIDGGALHERLQAQPQKHYQPVEATRIVRAAAEGIGHAHRRGIIHRDIKPGNIMMTNDGQVKVSDFGLARDVLQGRDIVGEGHCLGTPRYMSPEQALGEQPTAASDLYSLAATYYALVTGRAPFDGDNDRVIMKKQVTAAVPDPRLLVPTLPIALFRFFEKAMAKEPEDRYQTADEFIAALDRLDFGQTDTGSLSAQSLAAQIGPIALEDRTTHLTETLDRAVHRAQRQQRTPMTGDSVLDGSGSMSVNMSMSRDSGGVSPKVWIAIAVGLVVLLAAAIIAAVLLARSGTSPAASSKGTSSAAALPPAPPVATPTAAAPVVTPTPAATPSAAAAITPTVSPPVVTPTRTTPGGVPTPTSKPAPAKSAAKPSPTRKPGGPPTAELEQLARDALNGVKEEESNPHYSKDDIIRMYEDNVLSIKDYKGTKAAKEAEAAVKRLRVEDTPKAPPTP
jgi:serine/threonine-protein kinase